MHQDGLTPTWQAVSTPPSLFVDLYELTMAESYLAEGMRAPATFSLFARKLPKGWGYFLAAGLDDVLTYLESLAFDEADLAYLRSTGLFSPPFLDYLRKLRFTGSVRALPEGTACFPDEPLIEVTAPMIEAQLVESAIVNQVHFQTIIASKAARCVEAARGRRLVNYSLRRTHGTDAGLKVARCAYLAGFDATSNVLAGQAYGIPIAGTMAHSYIQAFEDELAAFRTFARAYPDTCTLLIDTYDTVEGARRAAIVGRELAADGHRLCGVRLDSGDLVKLAFEVRRILDEAGLPEVTIFASGSLDEHSVADAIRRTAPIDGFGVGSRLGVSADAPYLDMAYKLVSYDGRPTLKLSANKATWPGPKQVWRARRPDGTIADVLGLADEPDPRDARPLLVEVMRNGCRLSRESLTTVQARARTECEALPDRLRMLDVLVGPSPRVSDRLASLRADVCARLAAAGTHCPPERSDMMRKPNADAVPSAVKDDAEGSSPDARHVKATTAKNGADEVELENNIVTEADLESFPASDPPPWWPGRREGLDRDPGRAAGLSDVPFTAVYVERNSRDRS